MISNPFTAQSNSLANQAAKSADHAINSAQRVANGAIDSLATTAQDVQHQAAPLLHRVTQRASELAHRSVDAVRDGTQQLREKAQRASDNTLGYVRDEPVKAMLIAAAAGVTLLAVIGMLSRARTRD